MKPIIEITDNQFFLALIIISFVLFSIGFIKKNPYILTGCIQVVVMCSIVFLNLIPREYFIIRLIHMIFFLWSTEKIYHFFSRKFNLPIKKYSWKKFKYIDIDEEQ